MEKIGKRTFTPLKALNRCYKQPETAQVDRELYRALSESSQGNVIKKITVPRLEGLAWEVKEGQVVRFVVAYGSQVGDMNLWNLHDTREHFYSGKTRQIHRTHLTTYDRLWSNLPYIRPLATITADSLSDYGIDPDGGSVHDCLGTRCDPYTRKLITDVMSDRSCHKNLIEAVKPWGLQEEDVHDAFNIFMCSGFTSDHEYYLRGSPAEVGDYIEMVAEMDLLMALSACPHGDCSIAVGDKEVPDDKCFPLDVIISQPSEEVFSRWKKLKADK